MSAFQGTVLRTHRTKKILAAAVLAASFGGTLFAADTTYTGAAAGTWNVAGNWNNGAPTAGNNTFVDGGAVGNTTVTVTATTTTGTLNISAGDQVVVNNTASLSLNGSGTSSLLNNAGEVVLNGTTGARLRFINTASGVDAQITGGGTITLNGPNAILDGTAAVRVVNTNNYIHGQGNIGAELITFDNHATIAADVNGGTLTLDPDGGSGTFSFMRNLGVMRAMNGATLDLSGTSNGTFLNTGGLIQAQDSSTVLLRTSASVVNGTIEAQNNGTVRYTGTPSISNATLTSSGTGSHRVASGQSATFSSVTNTGFMIAENNSDLNINTALTNNGTINIEAGASQTLFNIQNNATLSGSGQLVLSGTNAGISGPDDARLTNASGHTIRGEGRIGFVSIWFDNQGLIAADVAGGTLELSADGTAGQNAFINSGTLRATNGGTLVLNGAEGGFNNTGGLIEAQDGSQVRLVNSASIVGGTFNSIGTGTLRVAPGNIEGLTDVTNNGVLIGENGSNITVAGTITNNATIRIDSGANQTLFSVAAPTTLAGAGVIILNGPLAGIAGSNDQRLTNGASHTIRGQGFVGGTEPWVTNDGLIVADVPGGTLTLAADGTAGQNAFINTGTIRATNGGLINFGPSEGEFNSTGGTVEAQNGSTVRFFNASILGGTFASTGTGEFRVPSGFAVLFNDNTLNGTLLAENNSNIQTFGPLVNNGTILINSGTNSTFLNVRAPTLLGGTGQLILSGTAAFAGGLNDQRLTNDVSHTIRGQGSVGGTEIWVTNNGTILADVNGGSITLGADFTAGANAFINDGTLRATNGATIQFGPSEGGFSGLGTVIADANSNVRAAGVSANQGRVIGEGTFTNQGGSNFIATHYRVSNLIITGAATRVRAGGGTLGTSQVSNLSITGTGGGLDLADHDLAVDYTGASQLSTIRGWLATGYNGGNWNGVGINSTAAQAAAPTPDKTGLGNVEATDMFSAFPANFRGVSVDSTSVLVGYTLLGDTNLDRIVNITDFARLAANFNTPSRWFNGDFNYSGMTDINDFALLAANFNKSLPVDLPRGASVPEPSSLTLLGVAAALKRRRRPS